MINDRPEDGLACITALHQAGSGDTSGRPWDHEYTAPRAQQFLLDFAELIERYGGADFYYTTSDDGIHIKLDGDREDCFVGFDLLPKDLRAAAV